MPAAVIQINGVSGSDDDLPLNALVQLNSLNAATTYEWSILDQPPGAADSLSATAVQNPTFTPTKEGSYLVKLILNKTLGDETTINTICGVRQLKTNERVPAAGEVTEVDTAKGWALAVNRLLRLLDSQAASPNYRVASALTALTTGDIVFCTDFITIKAGLPGEEQVPGYGKLLGSDPLVALAPFGVFVSKVTGGGAANIGDLVLIQTGGVAGPFAGWGGVGVGTKFYTSGSTIDVALGSGYYRIAGSCVKDDGVNVWVALAGCDAAYWDAPLYRGNSSGSGGLYGGINIRHLTAALRLIAGPHDISIIELLQDTAATVPSFVVTDPIAGVIDIFSLLVDGSIRLESPTDADHSIEKMDLGDLRIKANGGDIILQPVGAPNSWRVQADGTLTADAPALVSGVDTPVSGQDAANKDYVDGLVPTVFIAQSNGVPPVGLVDIALADLTAALIEVVIVAKCQGLAKSAYFVRTLHVYRHGAGAVLDTVQTPIADVAVGGATYNISSLVAFGNNIQLAVQGALAEIVDWTATARVVTAEVP